MIFRRFRRRQRLTAKHRDRYVSQLRYELIRQKDIGYVSQDEFDRVFDHLNDPILAQRAILESQDRLGPIDWEGIIQWVADNWPTIVQIVFSIALLFLGDTPRRDEQLWPED